MLWEAEFPEAPLDGGTLLGLVEGGVGSFSGCSLMGVVVVGRALDIGTSADGV